MAWLEAHDELINHPKTIMLGGLMGWNKWESAGRLLGFWFWALKYAPTGDLRKFNDEQMGASVELNGDAAASFVKSMVASCWIDRAQDVFRIHDWPDFTKRFLKDSRFRDRPDKWDEVLKIYSRVTHELPTHLPTNLPTNPPTIGRRRVVGPAKKGN